VLGIFGNITSLVVFSDADRVSQELKKEAQMCKLHHTNIVALHAVISEPGHYGIVMEFVFHGALDDYLLNNDVRYSVSCLLTYRLLILQ